MASGCPICSSLIPGHVPNTVECRWARYMLLREYFNLAHLVPSKKAEKVETFQNLKCTVEEECFLAARLCAKYAGKSCLIKCPDAFAGLPLDMDYVEGKQMMRDDMAANMKDD